MDNEITIQEFVKRFNNGEFDSHDRRTQCNAGWYDWWCKDNALARKTKTLGKKVEAIADSPRFDKTKTYVFFKNICPCVGPLYDQFSICDIETGDVLFCVQHLECGSHGCDRAHWEVYSSDDFRVPKVNGNWRAVLAYFMKKD